MYVAQHGAEAIAQALSRARQRVGTSDPLRAELDAWTHRLKIARLGIAAGKQIARNDMPEIGGKSLAADVKIGLAGLKQEIAELRMSAAGAITELKSEIVNGKEGVKRIQAETAAVKDAFAEILGNETASA